MIEDVYGARRAALVFEDTWGHLRPGSGRHLGHIVAACSAYDSGERSLITAEFRDVPDSPWLYDAMYALINDADMAEGCVYRFMGALVADGTACRFEGHWSQVPTAE